MTRWFRPLIALLALGEAGFMAFDGIRALIVGEYITPRSGELGPWSAIVSAVGITPHSTLMKSIFAGYGLTWLGIIAAYVVRARWAWWAMVLAALFSLWYLPAGTSFGLLIIALLLVQRRQSRA